MLIKNTVDSHKNQNEIYKFKDTSKLLGNKNLGEVLENSADQNGVEDELTISDEALELLNNSKTQKEDKPENKMKEYYAQLREMLEEANEAGEAAGEGYKVLGKCIKIALRIVSGDIVPIQDEKFLMENNEKLYSMAMNMRMIKEEPEEWDSILEEDKDVPKLADGSAQKVMEIPEVVQVEE